MEASHINLEIKGKEKAAFTRYWTEQEQDRTVERHERVKMAHLFAHYKMDVHEIQGHML